ncbi:MAG: class III poly(R)-hydroxyalkanoic acid synthase subunit PhaE [Magnetococcales bacterium]|nr:class III poly(R)-hydroxyalkanoic acid synthase subunit PhaE [Magnetococcales bacterium]
MANDAFSVDWMQGWSDLQRKIWNEWIAMAGELNTNRSFASMPGMEGAAQWPMQWLQQAMGAAGQGGGAGGGAMPWSMPWMQQAAGAASPGGGSGTAAPWGMPWMPQGMNTAPMDDWMRVFGVYSPESAPEKSAMTNMMAAASSFVRMSQEIFQSLQKMGEGIQDGADWTKMLDRSIQQAKGLFTGQDGGKAALDPMAAWGQPLQLWMGMLKNNPLFSTPALQSAVMTGMQSGLEEQGEAWLQQVLATPGLGLTREKQERLQEGMRDLLLYRKAAQEFHTLTSQVNVQALDLLHKRLLERGATQKPLESMRDLYVLWVDCCEEVNAEMVRGQAFQQVNSRMINAMMRVQKHVQVATDEMLAALHMPTRRELDSSHRQVQDLKRRLRAMEEEIKGLRTQDHSAEMRSIRDDLDRLDVRNLRQELADMKGLLEGAQAGLAGQGDKKAGSASRSRVATREKPAQEPAAPAAKKGE